MAFWNINLALPSARQWSRLWYGSWTGFCTNELTYHSPLHNTMPWTEATHIDGNALQLLSSLCRL